MQQKEQELALQRIRRLGGRDAIQGRRPGSHRGEPIAAHVTGAKESASREIDSRACRTNRILTEATKYTLQQTPREPSSRSLQARLEERPPGKPRTEKWRPPAKPPT